MASSVQHPVPLGVTLGRTIDLAQQVAIDEFRLWQLELQDRVGEAVRRGVAIGLRRALSGRRVGGGVGGGGGGARALVLAGSKASDAGDLAAGAGSDRGLVRTPQPADGEMSAALSREVLEERIVREKAALAEALATLRERARAEVDLSRRVRERPSAWLAGALVLGFLIGVRR